MATSTLKAINIALVGEGDLIELAKYANGVLAEKYTPTFRFNTLTPHISLLQMYVEKDRILSLTAELEALVSERSRRPGLQIKAIEEGPDFNSLKVPHFKFEKTEHLKMLHAEICARLSHYAVSLDKLQGANLAEAFSLVNGVANKDSIEYVKYFLPEMTKNEFSPHMSLGCAPLNVVQEMMEKVRMRISERIFEGDSVVIFHMANFCTADTIISSIPLKSVEKVLHDTNLPKQAAMKPEWFKQQSR